jgi:glycosyltransferase involved in cell wall biosynthesis
MRILIVNRALGTLFGGGESFDYTAARYLAMRGHEVAMITGRPLLGKPDIRPDGLRIHYLGLPNLRRLAYLTEKLGAKISAAFYHLDNLVFEARVFLWLLKGGRHQQFDVVQCCSLFRLPGWLTRLWRMPCISWLPGPPSGQVRRALPSLLVSPVFRLFTHGATVQDLEKKLDFKEGKDFFIIEPGVELERVDAVQAAQGLRRQVGASEGSFLGITVARLVPVKNHGLLLKAIAKAAEHADVHWIMVGDGTEMQTLRKQAEGLGLGKRIHFLGQRPLAEVHEWLAVSDVFAMTSWFESFSIAVLEAMAHKLPVIGTRVGYMQFLIRDSGGGVVVPPDDPGPLAAAIVRMAADREWRAGLAARGRSFVEHLDWPKVAEKLEDLYVKVEACR